MSDTKVTHGQRCTCHLCQPPLYTRRGDGSYVQAWEAPEGWRVGFWNAGRHSGACDSWTAARSRADAAEIVAAATRPQRVSSPAMVTGSEASCR